MASSGAMNILDFVEAGEGNDLTNAFLRLAKKINENPNPVWESLGGKVIVPAGTYSIKRQIVFLKPGVHIVGEGIQSTKLLLTADLGELGAVFKFDSDITGYSTVGVCVKDISINMASHTGSAIVLRKPYDGFILENINIDNLADSGIGIVIEPDNDDNPSDKVSQTLTAINVLVKHTNLTATAPCFYAEALQEAVFINCKAFGGPESYVNQAPCHGFLFVDCRGITLIGCSVAFTGLHGISIVCSNRPSTGFFLYGTTAESCKGIVKASGSVNSSVSQLYIDSIRAEGGTENTAGTFSLNKVIEASINSGSNSVTIDSQSALVSVSSLDVGKVKNSGQNCLVIGLPSGANNGYSINASAFSVAKEGTKIINGNTDLIEMHASGARVVAIDYPWSEGNTSLSLLTNRKGKMGFERVMLGEENSAGNGFRALKIAN
ncbi:hypothetical protein ABI244_14855 [Serratia ureilytica]|uniref:hypothetical protein n=1 Tax=Serratia ureilytica TaxID=300181 RepID=UPI0032677243